MILYETIMEELIARGWSTHDLADEAVVDYFELQDVIDGNIPISEPIAAGIAKAFGTSVELWLNLGKENRQ